jgi:hypothetical protein
MAVEALSIPDPHTVWVQSTMTGAKIQSFVDRGLLRSKEEVEWKAASGEEFPTEDVKEQVVFVSYFERGFNLPAGDFFRGLLFYYKLELVHLVPNSITIVSTLIHFCEAYLGISPHFLLWRHLFCVKSTGKRSRLVGVVMFYLRSGLKSEWIDTDLPDNNVGWRSEWFYIAGHADLRKAILVPKHPTWLLTIQRSHDAKVLTTSAIGTPTTGARRKSQIFMMLLYSRCPDGSGRAARHAYPGRSSIEPTTILLKKQKYRQIGIGPFTCRFIAGAPGQGA